MFKPRRMRWEENIVRMVEERNAYRVWLESQKGKDHQKDLDVGDRIVL
jgi:hypothetical protein